MMNLARNQKIIKILEEQKMKLGKLELTKKKLIIGGSVVLAIALISAGVIFACNANKPAEVKPEEAAVVQEATSEENKEQTEAKNKEANNEANNEVKDNIKNKGKKENKSVKDNKAAKDNNQKTVMPDVKTDLKVNGDEVVLTANGKDASSKMILTFNGDKLSKMGFEMNFSIENKESKEFKEAFEMLGFKVLESDAKSLKAELDGKLIEEMNKEGSKKQEIIDLCKRLLEAMKG